MSYTIYHRIEIHSNKATIFQAITTQEGLSRWWISDCMAKAEIGFVNEFVVNNKLNNKMKILDLQSNEKAVWLCLEGLPEWLETQVIFEIAETEEGLFLDFRHVGWQEQSHFFGICNYHWGRHLLMLKNLCETGTV